MVQNFIWKLLNDLLRARRIKCEIVVMSEVGSEKLDSQEIFEEIVSLLHCYSMKLYSKRKIQKVKDVLTSEENE